MKKIFLLVLPFIFFACTKETPVAVSTGGTVIAPPPPPPVPPPPPNPFPNWPYIYFQFPSSWAGSYIRNDTVFNWVDFRETIFNSNSVTAGMIDSLCIQEISGLIFNILDTTHNPMFWHEDVLESWLPGWEYMWFIRIMWKGRTNNFPFAANPPNGRLLVRFR